MAEALKNHWPEYLMEAALLGLFMLSASAFGVLLGHPTSPVRALVADETTLRTMMGLAMGSTAIALIYSPLGKRSGAHFNPAVTLSFLRLGKVRPWDAFFYVIAQFVGGSTVMLALALLVGQLIGHPAVNYVATLPGEQGPKAAFFAEVLISFVLMSTVLRVSNVQRLNRFTGIFAGALVATYITIESPISGMSMNPARTFASALPGRLWEFLWIYFAAPVLGMLLAAELFVRTRGLRSVLCAKLHHENNKRCIFRCNYMQAEPDNG
jgi:aquaporin Z